MWVSLVGFQYGFSLRLVLVSSGPQRGVSLRALSVGSP